MERLTIQQIDDAVYRMKQKCRYYGEPRGCNYPPGPLWCCDALDDVAEMAKEAIAYEDTGLTPEEITQMTKTKSIPICVMERAIKGIDAARVCDQAGRYDYELRSALKTVLEWYRAPIYRTEVYVSKRDGWLPKWWPEAALAKEAQR